ncbi:hypothetical protein EBAPG3_012935 [Nitrosospira lacus]|uniref:Uncharacterized protein n=1 Tax=Nitrosospira lacus TaxID=1288494 RepID=A0A1W6SS39_9PROT|nr:hypothetical protein [Nitrosospira lacus]ARO88599.1 hypothetical protein EBAPG3_012935 [Nitrosospira lacus]
MKHAKTGSNKEIIELNQQVSGPSLEELQRSHYIVEALMSTLPPHTKSELVDLLQTLAKGGEPQAAIDHAHQRAMQIVSDICKPNSLHGAEGEAYRREMGERRQRERRQK